MINIQLSKVEVSKLGKAGGSILTHITKNAYGVVGLVPGKSSKKQDPQAFIVGPKLMLYLLQAEDAYSKMVTDPNVAEMQTELQRLRLLCRGLLGELKLRLGEEAYVSENLLNRLRGGKDLGEIVKVDTDDLALSIEKTDSISSAIQKAEELRL